MGQPSGSPTGFLHSSHKWSGQRGVSTESDIHTPVGGESHSVPALGFASIPTPQWRVTGRESVPGTRAGVHASLSPEDIPGTTDLCAGLLGQHQRAQQERQDPGSFLLQQEGWGHKVSWARSFLSCPSPG